MPDAACVTCPFSRNITDLTLIGFTLTQTPELRMVFFLVLRRPNMQSPSPFKKIGIGMFQRTVFRKKHAECATRINLKRHSNWVTNKRCQKVGSLQAGWDLKPVRTDSSRGRSRATRPIFQNTINSPCWRDVWSAETRLLFMQQR